MFASSMLPSEDAGHSPVAAGIGDAGTPEFMNNPLHVRQLPLPKREGDSSERFTTARPFPLVSNRRGLFDFSRPLLLQNGRSFKVFPRALWWWCRDRPFPRPRLYPPRRQNL